MSEPGWASRYEDFAAELIERSGIPGAAVALAQDGRDVTAESVILATGTHAASDDHIPFDGQRIFTSDDVLNLERLPRSLTVVGAGVIGCELACIFATLGVRVTLVDKRERLLPFVDAVFNYPTLAECYKTAGFNGINRLTA